MPAKSGPKRDAFAEAAHAAGVPTPEFADWLQDYFRDKRLNPKQWWAWKEGRRPIPLKYGYLLRRQRLDKTGKFYAVWSVRG